MQLMPIISAIKPQKNKKRVNIYLDGRFAFGLDLENYLKLGLKIEQELSEEKVKEIVQKAEFQKTLDKLLNFASLRPRSIKEIELWFKRKRVHESIWKSLFNRLKRLNLIDDEKFAKWWVEQRLQFRFKSKRELIQELRLKGINKEIIEQVLSETVVDEIKMAKKLLEKNMYKYKNFDKFTAKRKMREYLARKGFNWETIKRVVDDFIDSKHSRS